jgi:dihydrofolate synthase/folylpolyglutamate synthase
MFRLAARLGDPQAGLRFLHLAGSNGKGSTAAFCESVLRAAGHRVGLYTSPHLVSIRERIQVDREPISEGAFAEGMTAVAAAAEGEPTFFELMTALSLRQFAREKVDWIVWETGLGGRLDATNIVRPAVSILTTISLEHTQYLGTRLEEIAREKAGIIKAGVPVVSGVGEGVAREVIAAESRRLGAPLHEVDMDGPVENPGLRAGRQWARLGGREYELGLIGAHQVRNAACAVAALRLLPDPPGLDAVARGLASVSWPGRFQIVSESPPVVLDGAHNTAAMRTLLATWCDYLASRGMANRPAHLLFGAVTDKDVAGMAALLRPHVDRVSLVRLASDRSADPADLARHFPGLACAVLDSLAAFRPDPDRPVLATGSLFLVGELLARRGGGENDLRLNEQLERPATPP